MSETTYIWQCMAVSAVWPVQYFCKLLLAIILDKHQTVCLHKPLDASLMSLVQVFTKDVVCIQYKSIVKSLV